MIKMATINADVIKNIALAVSLNWQIRLMMHSGVMANEPETKNIGKGVGGNVNLLCETVTPPSSTVEATDAYIRGIRINQAVQNKPSTSFEAVYFDNDNLDIFKYMQKWKNKSIKMRNQANAKKTNYTLPYGGLIIDNLAGEDSNPDDILKGDKAIIGSYYPDMVYPTECKHSELNGDNTYVKTTVTYTYSIFDYIPVIK